MIKIVSGLSIPVGSTVALANLCNQFNFRGHECVFHGPDRWHMDKCRSAHISDFRPGEGDIVISHGIRLRSVSDLLDLENRIASTRRGDLRSALMDGISRSFGSKKKPEKFRLVLSCHGDGPVRIGRMALPMFHKIRFSCDAQKNRHAAGHPYFVCPDFVHDLKKPVRKPEKVAGVIGCVRPGNMLEISIERALQDGMEAVIVYGYMLDPKYFYSKIAPLTKKYPGRIKYAGFIDDPQKMYDSISDVYRCAGKPWSTVKRECDLTNTRYHGPEPPKEETIGNDAIYGIWKRELGL